MPDIKEKLVELIVCPCESEVREGAFACPSRKDGECAKVTRLPYCVITKMVDHLIANGVTIQKWISVEERLPTEADADDVGAVLAIHKAARKKYYHWCSVADNPFDFTHWMPMPEPPKGE